MKNILGLDLGTSSVGWALVRYDDNNKPLYIIDMGVRRVPLSENEDKQFTKGQSITTNADRTKARTARKSYDRYQLRRQALTQKMKELGLMPDESLIKLPLYELWQLRANAATQKITLNELGRVLYHLNQKRGYKHAKKGSQDSKEREYVATINNRYSELKEAGLTIGQYFAQKLKETAYISNDKTLYTFRIKDKVYPRCAYEEEYDKIMACQQQFYPEVLTDEVISYIKNNIIYYQRELKSCKHLVSVCEFERRFFKDEHGNVIRNKDGEIVYDGPKVTPRTSPLFQLCKNWEAVNNIKFHNRTRDELFISLDQRKQMIQHLDSNELLKLADVHKILGINKKSGWYAGEQIGKGLKGNTTKLEIIKALASLSEDKIKEITRFDIKIKDATYTDHKTNTIVPRVDPETGEILQIVDTSYTKEPLYRIWHIIYSINNEKELRDAITKFLAEFGVADPDTVEKLAAIDFTTPGYGNKSAKAISKILPYLQQGLVFSDACEYVGYNHSNSITTVLNQERELKKTIPSIKKNELRQPTVEKILNQMINIFNSLNSRLRKNEQGSIDEVRIELARELKQSKDERVKTTQRINRQEAINKRYATAINNEGLDATRTRILKYRMWEESNMCCFYCGQTVNLKSFLEGTEVEREHVIPKRLLFDNSFSNQVCSCRKCNDAKAGRTAYDFMRTQPGFDTYVNKVNKMFLENKISHTKYIHLLASYDDYLERKAKGKETKEDIELWETFIERQLRLSQYIARKAQEILMQGCRNVYSTSGTITDLVRHTWGYDTIIHDLNLQRYRDAQQTSIKTVKHHGQVIEKEVINDWNKRLDHRHHAIDALSIACTTQSMIQRINTLHASRELMSEEITQPRSKWDDGYTLLQEWIREQMPFDRNIVMQHVANIIISMKAGKKVTTPGKRKIYSNGKSTVVQTGIIIPRGPLHEQTVYGKKKLYTKNSKGESILSDTIVVRYPLGTGMGYVFSGKETCKVVFDKKKNEYVIIDEIKKAIDYIVDYQVRKAITNAMNSMFPEGETYRTNAEKALKEKREYKGDKEAKKAFERLNNLEDKPIYLDKNNTIPIRRVRCIKGLSAVRSLKYKDGKAISFVAPGNNHHVALYIDNQGKYIENIVTFWQAVERVKYSVPPVITNPMEVWDDLLKRKEETNEAFMQTLPDQHLQFVMSLQQNEMFVLGMSEDEYNDAIATNNRAEINKHIYRVQSISAGDYWFRLHTETENDKTSNAKEAKKFYRVRSANALMQLNPHKIKISILGEILE